MATRASNILMVDGSARGSMFAVALLFLAAPCAAQQAAASQQQASQQQEGAQLPTNPLRLAYTLGPNDQILIRAFEVEEINEKPFRVDEDGSLNLPVVGRVRAAGLTVRELETELIARLKTYVRNPQVIVSVIQFRSEPVFFVGAFAKPGIYPLQGRRTLVEMISAIGGLQPNASRRIKLTRRNEYGPIPLPNAVQPPGSNVSHVEISMGSLRENVNPAEDIVLQSFDIITVERAEMVYTAGEISRIGGFELGERESISVLQLLALAGGLGKDAKPEQAHVLRPVLDTSRRADITINVKEILKGKASDFPLMPNDVLYIPTGSRKRWLERTALVAITLVPTIVVLAIQ